MKALEHKRMIECLEMLNKINGGGIDGEMLSIPDGVLTYVDRQDLAKGLISLLIPAIAQIERELSEIGVDFTS